MNHFFLNTEIAPNLRCRARRMCSRNALDGRALLQVQPATMIRIVTVGIMLSVNLQPGDATMIDNSKPDRTIAEI
jgi:hypothetical protein